MRSSSLLRVLACGIAALAIAAVPLTVTVSPAVAAQAVAGTPTRAATAVPRPVPHPVKDACARARAGHMSCLSVMRTDVQAHKGLYGTRIPVSSGKTARPAAGATTTTVAPSGYGPADLQAAYALAQAAASAGGGTTVAVVDAFDDSNAEADLAVYRAQYGLPACTTANGCFRKVAENGSTDYPSAEPLNNDWAAEASLDIDMVSAICPSCRILLIEADDDSAVSLGRAVDEAVHLGAKYVSNSYGGAESSGEPGLDTAYYNHPGVVITASTGDQAYGAEYPAASPYVTAVGGTTLLPDAGVTRGWTETAWSGTGSGCSSVEPKPAWQSDTGCAARTVGDVSAIADPNTGVAFYDTFDQAGWGVVGGTSVAAPIIASVYALAGSPTPGTYPASYPYADQSALNDVITGSNGTCSPAYLCTAGAGYDGPTGLGTPDGTAAFTAGPHGVITGTVTNASTGEPVAGAAVSIGTQTGTTDAHGRYAVYPSAGTYTVTVSDFGYASQSVSGVQALSGQSATENFTLQPIPTVTVSGTVTDGSGQGWPLYAKVTVPGTPVTAYTNPSTGRYSLSLPQGATYDIQAAAVSQGYQQALQPVTAGTASQTQDFSLPVDATSCDAPGYQFDYTGTTQGFDGTSVPAGWSVVNPNTSTAGGWEFGDPGGITNQTGGTGNFASAANPGPTTLSESYLYSPVTDLSHAATPILSFDNYVNRQFTQSERVEVSTDGGQTWTTVWYYSGLGVAPSSGLQLIPLPMAAGMSQVQVRFEYYTNRVGSGWEVDNVYLGDRACDPVSGGLVTGRVTDGNTRAAVDGATVTGPSGSSTVTALAPSGTDGFYSMFVPGTGSQQLTASLTHYATSDVTADVAANAVTPVNFVLAAGRLSVTAAISGTAAMGSATTAAVTYKNTGTLPVTVTLSQQPGEFTLDGQPAAAAATAADAPLRLVHGAFRPLIATGLTAASAPATARARTASPGLHPAATPSITPAVLAASAKWVPIADYPVPVAFNAAATDPATGLLYSVGGQAVSSATDNLEISAGGYAYDPATQRWTPLPDMPEPRYGAGAAFLDGKLYVIGGLDTYGLVTQAPVAPVASYDPATATWSAGADMPDPVAGAAVTTLDGKLYAIGGCAQAGSCQSTDVQVYDPATDSWSAAASYPEPLGYAACGTIGHSIYCAGGTTGSSETSDAYAYDPAAGTWSPIAALPIALWGSGYSDANGHLEVSGGVTGNMSAITNHGYAYDPGSNSWAALPNSADYSFGGGSGCGLYTVGGGSAGGYPEKFAEELPGYGACGSDPVPWLSQGSGSFTVSPHSTVTVTATLNAADPSITQPGSYTATLLATSDTPYAPSPTAVTLTAGPPSTWGEIAGTVTGLSCDGTAVPLPGAIVEVTTSTGSSYSLLASDAGRYALWLDVQGNPLLIIAADDGWQPQFASVSIAAGTTTTQDFPLATTLTCS